MGKFTLSIPDKLLKDFDAYIEDKYTNRSEAIRAAMKLLMREGEGYKSAELSIKN